MLGIEIKEKITCTGETCRVWEGGGRSLASMGECNGDWLDFATSVFIYFGIFKCAIISLLPF